MLISQNRLHGIWCLQQRSFTQLNTTVCCYPCIERSVRGANNARLVVCDSKNVFSMKNFFHILNAGVKKWALLCQTRTIAVKPWSWGWKWLRGSYAKRGMAAWTGSRHGVFPVVLGLGPLLGSKSWILHMYLQKIMMIGLSKGFVKVFQTGHGHTKYGQVDINHIVYVCTIPIPATCLPAVLRAYSFANNSSGFPNIGTLNIQLHLPNRQFTSARIVYICSGRWLGSLMYNKNNTCDRRSSSLRFAVLSLDKIHHSPREGVKIPTLAKTMCPELDGQKMRFFSLGSVVSACRVLDMVLHTWMYPVWVGQAFSWSTVHTCACRMQDVPVSVFSSEKKEYLGEVQAGVVMKADPLFFPPSSNR